MIKIVPGGMQIAYGGTRTEVKLKRPWQPRVRVDPSKCPFEKEDDLYNRTITRKGELRVISNKFTPFLSHQLIISDKCWRIDRLWRLGGPSIITDVLTINSMLIEEFKEEELILSAHIGYLAGQNFPHLHFHRIKYGFEGYEPELMWGVGGRNSIRTPGLQSGALIEKEIRTALISPREFTIAADSDFAVVAGGHRAGQCFIVPRNTNFEMTESNISNLASAISMIVNLYNTKFRSEDKGLRPDYMVALKFLKGNFSYGFYLPILNHWGATEYLALLGDGRIILPWPHETTVEYLLA